MIQYEQMLDIHVYTGNKSQWKYAQFKCMLVQKMVTLNVTYM